MRPFSAFSSTPDPSTAAPVMWPSFSSNATLPSTEPSGTGHFAGEQAHGTFAGTAGDFKLAPENAACKAG